MDLILTSFGLSHLERNPNSTDIFYRMPPVTLAETTGTGFMPDYSVLLLCDRIILDLQSYNRLILGEPTRSYNKVAEVIKALYEEGFIRLEDFDSIVKNNHEILERMLQHDLENLEKWINPFKESTEKWRDFIKTLQIMRENDYEDYVEGRLSEIDKTENEQNKLYNHTAYYLHDIASAASVKIWTNEIMEKKLHSKDGVKDEEFIHYFQNQLKETLSYVNANLVVSNTLGVGFHDWYDFEPFYREKFLSIEHEQLPTHREIEKIDQLFKISFPEFAFWNTKSILKAMKDKRIQDLRNLVNEATIQSTPFDREFANKVLREVLQLEMRISRIRNIASYITLPIGFIPWIGTIVQKGTEEIIGAITKGKIRKEYRWFYLISDISTKSQRTANN
jgi:hypothetical protein